MAPVLSPSLMKGLFLPVSITAIPEDAVPDCANVHFSHGGEVFQREGSSGELLDFSATPFSGIDSAPLYVVEDAFYLRTDATKRVQYIVGPSAVADKNQIIAIAENRGTGAKTIHTIVTGITAPAGYAVAERAYGVSFTSSGPLYSTVICTSSSASPYQISGAVTSPTATTITHTDWSTAGSYPLVCASYKGRMWYTGNPSFPTRIWASEPNTAGGFAGTGAAAAVTMDLNLTTGGRIIGIKSLYDILLVFTTQGIYRITGVDATDFSNSFISPVTTVSQHSIVNAEDSLFFLSQGGVYRVTTTIDYGDIRLEDVAPAISPAIEDTDYWKLAGTVGAYDEVHHRLLYFTETNYPFARTHSGTLRLTQATVTTELTNGRDVYLPASQTCFAFDLRAQSWTRHYWETPYQYVVSRERGDGEHVIEAYCIARSVPTAAVEGTHVAEFRLFNEAVLTDQILTDSATAAAPTLAAGAVEAYVRPRPEHFGTIARRKSHFHISAVMRNMERWMGGVADRGALTLNYLRDYSGTVETFGSIYRDHPLNPETVGAAGSVSPYFRFRAPIAGSANVLQLEFYNNTLDRTFWLHGFEYGMTVRRTV